MKLNQIGIVDGYFSVIGLTWLISIVIMIHHLSMEVRSARLFKFIMMLGAKPLNRWMGVRGQRPRVAGSKGQSPWLGSSLEIFYFQRSCCFRNSSENVISENRRTNLQFRKPFENQLFSVKIPNGCTVSSTAAPVRLLQNLINSSGSSSRRHIWIFCFLWILSDQISLVEPPKLIWSESVLHDFQISIFVLYIESP